MIALLALIILMIAPKLLLLVCGLFVVVMLVEVAWSLYKFIYEELGKS